MKRRDFVCSTAAAALAAGLPAHATSHDIAPGRLAIFVYLKGGSDGYSAFVPYADPLYRSLRPTLAVARDALIPINAELGFNRHLSPLLPAWEAGELALVQGIGFPQVNQQHYPDAEQLFTAADTGAYVQSGWLTRALDSLAPMAAGLHAVALGDLDIRNEDPMGPFRGERLAVLNVQHPKEWLAKRDPAACAFTATPAARAAKALHGYRLPEATLSTTFPSDTFGAMVRLAVELAAAMPMLPALHLTLNAEDGDHHHAFDTHWDQAKYHPGALQSLSAGLAALRKGLIEIGRWQDSLIVTLDEFGRSPVENERRGTHHGASNTHLALGGRVRGGLLGQRPPVLRNHSIGGPPPVIDYRELFSAVIERHWQRSATNVFERRHTALALLRS
jgi:uncharacterized protein (DUF1501 family)